MSASSNSTESYFPFLRLPAELRNEIYSLLLTMGTIKISDFPGANYVQNPLHATVARRLPYELLPLSLLQVCRDIYRETRLLLYESNTFKMWSWVAPQFLRARTPDQLRSLRSLTINAAIFCEGDIDAFQESMRDAAKRTSCLERFELNITIRREEPWLPKKGLAEAVENWSGRGLKVGKVMITRFALGAERGVTEIEEFTEELSGRLTAGPG